MLSTCIDAVMPRALLLAFDNHDQMMKEAATVVEFAGLAYMADTNPLRMPLGKPYRYLLSGVMWVMYERSLARTEETSKPMYKYL
jgi:hypothetical protein